MYSPKLLWNMAWRGEAWGLPAGLILGGGYSVLVLGCVVLISRLAGVGYPQPPPALFLVYTLFLLGLLGALVGGLIGAVSGPVGGILLFVLTRFFFCPPKQCRLYRWVAGAAGAVYGGAATLIGVQLVSQLPIAPPVNGTSNLMLFYILPTLIAAAVCLFISLKIADWYLSENVTPSAEPRPQIPSIQPLAS